PDVVTRALHDALPISELREKGFREEIAKAGNIAFLENEEESGATVDTAQKAAERMLAKYPDLDAIFAPNESSTTGVLRAMESTRSEERRVGRAWTRRG